MRHTALGTDSLVRGKKAIPGSHNAGVAGSSPAPAICKAGNALVADDPGAFCVRNTLRDAEGDGKSSVSRQVGDGAASRGAL